ncbi:chemotaxis response regulator protein-glutamate methylesterase [bacterium AH-315-L15]|nr:chemotaxis response regulator protein-glutamate methylesterase [bacterium AH-315-L15]
MSDPIRVLIVDDAIVVRRAVTEILERDLEISVVGTAADGKIALQKIVQLNPDVLVLDIEMPVCDGFEVLRELRRTHSRIWTVMFSTLTQRGAGQTIEALSLGAHDYVSKPTSVSGVNGYRQGLERVAVDLIPKIKQFINRRPGGIQRTKGTAGPSKPLKSSVVFKPSQVPEVVAIGVSTGGPEALSKLLPGIPKTFPAPILIVQHMPALFTRLLAERLNKDAQIKVIEAVDGMALEPSVAYIAPGGYHLSVQKSGTKACVVLNQDPPENSCRPAADYLFRSVAEIYGNRGLGLIMTGMGNDGLKGLRLMKEKGATVIAQDEASCVVWGMPSAVVKEGLAVSVLPLGELSRAIACCFS